ncbi:Protein gir2 [Saxophila tyrrhenica]|uniref:Protein gir2 n=1 Tax=Saxophila tyrrhenica TaxID=1690608 RepID=A0AAV9P0I9_9PEZI|nr:Protein gir2 [Saxophila tyrrhenica]
MGREDQKEEREVLDSIFPEEIQDISDTEYRITIALDVQPQSEEEPAAPVIILNYPDEAPSLDVTAPPNALKHQHLDVQEDKARLLDSLQPTIEENMGIAMVFSLVSTLKDSAELLIAERQQAVQAQKEFESRQAEAEENRKFEGQKVTAESFLAWREKFRQDMEEEKARRAAEVEAEERKKRGGKPEEKKLTGKQLWQQGLAGNAIDDDDEGEDAMEGMKELKVDG